MISIDIQQIWTAPSGKIKVITTKEEDKYNCYDLSLFQYLEVGKKIDAEVENFTNKKGEPAIRIIDVIVNGQPVKGKEPKPEKVEGLSQWVVEQVYKTRSMAFSYAKDMYLADKITDKQLFPTADRIAEWMYQVTITKDTKVE